MTNGKHFLVHFPKCFKVRSLKKHGVFVIVVNKRRISCVNLVNNSEYLKTHKAKK